LGEKKQKSRVAWAGAYRGGGNLDEKIKNQMRTLLDDFGIVLEEEAKEAGIDRFVFPLYREFNLLGALTTDQVLFVIAPSMGGMPTFSWLDWRDDVNYPQGQELANAVKRELGWTSISILPFPTFLLDAEFEKRSPLLRVLAKSLIKDAISKAERQARIVRLRPIFKGREFLVEKDLCFVLMPFREQFFRIYNEHIKPTLEDVGLRVMKADDIFGTTEIMEDIWEHINKARIIVADVTSRNANVFYELGIAHTVGKSVIILTQNKNDVPFDLAHLRYIKYTDDNEGWNKLKSELKKTALKVLGK
jgi:hypothetical protein